MGSFFGLCFGRFLGPKRDPKRTQNASKNHFLKRAEGKTAKTRNQPTSQRFLLFLRPRLAPKQPENGPTWVPKGLQKRGRKKYAKKDKKCHSSLPQIGVPFEPVCPKRPPRGPKRPPRGPQEAPKRPPRGLQKDPQGPPTRDLRRIERRRRRRR